MHKIVLSNISFQKILMARKYKIKTKNKSLLSRLIPEPIQAFFARRIVDGVGVVFLVGAVTLCLSLVSYHSEDPSLNVSKSAEGGVHNWLGSFGAFVSDISVQIFGIASFLVVVALTVWGMCILKRRSLSPLWARFVGLIIALFTGAVAMARIPSSDWLAQPYLGGSSGRLFLQRASDQVNAAGLPHEYLIVCLVFAILTLALMLFVCAVRRCEIKFTLSMFWFGVCCAAYFVAEKALAFYGWLKHYNDPDYKPKLSLKRVQKPAISKKDRAENKPEVLERKEPTISTPLKKQAVSADAGTQDNIKVVAQQDVEKVRGESQTRFSLFEGGEWTLPSLDLLQEVPEDRDADQMDESALRMNAELLMNVLEDFNIKGDIVSIHPGPVVTLYELEPAAGIKSSRVISLVDDIARSMSAVSVRAAVVPGRNVIGIEIPNKVRQTVYMRDMLTTRDYEKVQAKLPLILGKDIGGQPIIADLARMPHLLVAGTTGSGKSVAVNTMILSLLYRLPPEKCRFIMIDPKMLELSCYNDIPHLLSPVVTEPGKAVVALKWLVAEMEDRYRSMSKLGVRNIDGYNARLAEAREKGEALMRKVQTGFDPETGKPVYEEQPLDLTDLPYIVVIVDEFADLMLVAGKDVEAAIQRLAQMARAAGIHIIMATQRPSVDVITGVIKANFPTRISFAVTSKIDSRTILGEGGAEQLLGMGDMLYMAAGGQVKRVHGPFSSDADVENVVNFLKTQSEPSYLEDITEGSGDFTGEGLGDSNEEKVDELYDQAVALVARERKASTSFVQRYLQIGYNRAARIVEEMERQSVIGPANHVGKREVLVSDMSETG